MSEQPSGEIALRRVSAGLRQWFLRPPRKHGEVEYHREVSFLELFYDLVYVVAIGQAAHHLAEHVDWEGVRDFAIVFGLIWFAWFNGTVWHELHGREDGRSRNNIFAQMGLIALLAVFTGDATGDDGTAFAVVYAILFTWFTWQWFVVHHIDDDPRYRPTTTRYLVGMVATVAAIVISSMVDDDGVRVGIWAAVVIAWVVGGLVLMTTDRTAGFGEGVTASLVERFGLVTIIVLGEVVIGVVDGISDAEDRDAMTVAVGIVGLSIGMGIWWNYFDLLGRRVPGRRGGRLADWMFVHLPLTGGIAAAGAAMVSLVEHAGDDRTPSPTAWLLGGSLAVALAGIALATLALPDDEFPTGMTRHILPTFATAIAVILVVAALRPAPLVLTISYNAILFLTWLWLFVVFLAHGGDPNPDPDHQQQEDHR